MLTCPGMSGSKRWSVVPLRMGRPRGIARVIAIAAVTAYFLAGGRFHHPLVPAPWDRRIGLAGLMLLGVLFLIQATRGEVESTQDDPTVLGLDGSNETTDTK